MSDLGLQPSEVWKQPDRLEAEGSEVVQKKQAFSGVVYFLLPARPSLYTCHLLGIRRLVTCDLTNEGGDSRLETPEELQLHHKHLKILFLTVVLLFAQ
jgi:hypothetical protein